MRRAIRNYGVHVVSILVLALVAAIAGSYILVQQRLRTPFDDSYAIKAEFAATAGLTPGLGQAVNVAGVKVGTIGEVKLRDGRAVVTMNIKPSELPRVRADARATLEPVTPGKDLVIQLFPGRAPAPVLEEGATLPVAATTTPIDSDELTATLDHDTREFLDTLISGAGTGLDGRGQDMRALLRALGPTTEQVAAIGDALAGRRRALRRLVHSLAELTRAAGSRDDDLTRVVEAANATLGALTGEDTALRASLDRLPGTLSAARTSLDNAAPFARTLGPALDALQPAVRRLPAALRAARPLVDEAVPILRRQVRPFVRGTLPVGRNLRPAIRDLNIQTPDLTSAFAVLQYVGNELGHNPPGDDEGYLFWTSWFFHNANSLLSTEDAHGVAWRGLAVTSCSSFADAPALAPLLELVTGPLPVCP